MNRHLTQEEVDALAAEFPPPANMGLLEIHAIGKGGGSWAPYEDPTVDYSVWGTWEAWQHLGFGELPGGASVGAYITGDWIAWNRETGMTIGFQDKTHMTARQQAVILCRIQNGELLPPPDMSGLPETWERNTSALPTREVVSMPVAQA